jgi:hypothetical protein
MPTRSARILILCKTYPSPSAAHVETSCVAGMEEDGSLIRIYPMPFRLVADEKQFRKWQWISARVEKSKKDHRRESHKIFVDTIHCEEPPLSTKRDWLARREYIDKLPVFQSHRQLEEARVRDGLTLGLVRPSNVLGLDISPVGTPDWSKAEIDKLLQLQQQADLFDDSDPGNIALLKKLPFDFHYRYECAENGSVRHYRHKIVDWEAGALFWNVRRSHGE